MSCQKFVQINPKHDPMAATILSMISYPSLLLLICLPLLLGTAQADAQSVPAITQVCETVGLQPRGRDYPPGGLILTAFDRASQWVYNVSSNSRYPLPETNPCASNCRLSPDARWISYVDSATQSYFRMRLDGTGREPLVNYASDVSWWSADTLLVWTPAHEAYLRPESADAREPLPVAGVFLIQPGGRSALGLRLEGDTFYRTLVDLGARALGIEQTTDLGIDRPYFNDAGWSPDGEWLALVAPTPADLTGQTLGAELYAIRPGEPSLIRWTYLTAAYGPLRINGRGSGDLAWSPDGTRIAFWVTPLRGLDPAEDSTEATLHILDVATGTVRAYCGLTLSETVPDTPRLIWSPEGSRLAFGAALPGDPSGYRLIALDPQTGTFTELSFGLYPVFGRPSVVAWGYGPA
jgi:hypothetical protein